MPILTPTRTADYDIPLTVNFTVNEVGLSSINGVPIGDISSVGGVPIGDISSIGGVPIIPPIPNQTLPLQNRTIPITLGTINFNGEFVDEQTPQPQMTSTTVSVELIAYVNWYYR